jgi:hypothetical protein
VCDFDGDGKDDLFLPTGTSWWYSSGGKMNWVYLFDAHERLEQLRLGDFNGDRRCDVLAQAGDQWSLSSGGTSEWQSLGSYGVPLDQLAVGDFNGDKRADIFHRDPSGRWSVVSPPSKDWRVLGGSSFPLSQLHFGDFTGDGVTDILAIAGGRWSISKSGTEPWQTLNPKLGDSLDGALIADVDGNGIDDVVRLGKLGVLSTAPATTGFASYRATWQVSWDGRSDWNDLTTLTGIISLPLRLYPFAGRFDDNAGADLLLVDDDRLGRLYSKATGQVATLNLYAY